MRIQFLGICVKWLEGLKIELELSLSDANVGVLSRDSRQPIISKSPAGGGFLNTSDVATQITVHAYNLKYLTSSSRLI